jgi:hypothetical protein
MLYCIETWEDDDRFIVKNFDVNFDHTCKFATVLFVSDAVDFQY